MTRRFIVLAIALVAVVVLVALHPWRSRFENAAGAGPRDEDTGTTSAPTRLSPTTRGAADITFDKWAIHVDGVRSQTPVPMYLPSEDTDDSSSVVSIAPCITPSRVAAAALALTKSGRWIVFSGGGLTQPTDGLLTLRVNVTNTDAKKATFKLGDVVFKGADGEMFSCVGVSIDSSQLVGKPTEKSREAVKSVPLTIDAGNAVWANYCFVVPSTSLPARLWFGMARTDYLIRKLDDLSVDAAPTEKGMGFSMGGQMDIDVPEGFGTIKASGASGDAIAQYAINPQLKPAGKIGVTTAAQVGSRGATSMFIIETDERSLGIESHRQFPCAVAMNGVGFYFGGELSFSQAISPIELKTSIGSVGLTFSSSFKAEKGDVLGAYATQDTVLSIRRASEDQ
ncbi:MAG: hypothetical protein ABR964_08160 [Tepidisphaeraceae bacterium]|jgi:hypothetical protein